MFPEGTRSRDGRVARFKGGSFYLALEAGLPVVPLSVVGSRHVMLKGRLATYPGRGPSGRARADRHAAAWPVPTPKAFGERVRTDHRA